jgi:hypothetical protein
MPDVYRYRIAQAGPAAKSAGKGLLIVIGRLTVLCLALSGNGARADLPEMQFRAASLEFSDVQLLGVSARIGSGGAFELLSDRISAGEPGLEWSGLAVTGTVQTLELDDEAFRFAARVAAVGLAGGFTLQSEDGRLAARLELDETEMTALGNLFDLPEPFEWLTRGRLRAVTDWRQDPAGPGTLTVAGQLTDVAFDSPEGRFAGEALSLDFQSSLSAADGDEAEIAVRLGAGELLIDDFYRDFTDGGIDLVLQPQWADGLGSVEFDARDDGALNLDGRLELGADQGLQSIVIERLELYFPLAYRRYLEPMAAAWTLSGLEVTGRMSWQGQWSAGVLASGDLELEDLAVVDVERRRFAVSGLYADLRPGDHRFESQLRWQGLLFGRINLGAGRVALDTEPHRFALSEPLNLSVLGGGVTLHTLALQLPDAESHEADFQLSADLEAIDLEQLTAAFGWPRFTGSLSGRIPGVRLVDEVIEVDGDIQVDVFDGTLTLGDLKVERPFGVLPSLSADVVFSRLDLEMLTSAFSFGRISGRLEGYVSDLRMLDWRPVAFDAWLGTPPQQKGANDISRRAVKDLTAIGGGSATAALTNPLLRVFNRFSYRRLGLGCRLNNNVCALRGISEDEQSALIMEGAGVPKVTIRAYNREVDWPRLLAHLKAATQEDAIRFGD